MRRGAGRAARARARPWRAGGGAHRVPRGDGLEATASATSSSVASNSGPRDALRREHELPPRWRRATDASATLELTPLELEELGERFESLLDEFRGASNARGTRRVIVSFGAAVEP